MTHPSSNVLREARDMFLRDQRDQVFLATATDVTGQNVTIRRAGQTVDEGPYVAVDGLTVVDDDSVVVLRVGSRYVVIAKLP